MVFVHRQQKIALIGGGPISLFMALAAKKLGYMVHVLDQDPDAVAASHADKFICIDFESVSHFILENDFDYVIYETKEMPLSIMKNLATRFPNNIFSLLFRDKLWTKQLLSKMGFDTIDFFVIDKDNIGANSLKFPVFVKPISRSAGAAKYIIHNEQSLQRFSVEYYNQMPFLLEPVQDNLYEFYITVSRNEKGQVFCLPPMKPIYNGHEFVSSTNALDLRSVILQSANKICEGAAMSLNVVGSLTFEFFYLANADRLVINDAYANLHDSGFWTLDGCNISQFEQHVRAICNLDLIQPLSMQEVFTKYIIGYELIDWLDRPSDNLTKKYIYGNRSIEEGKYMGHINFLKRNSIN